MSTEPRRRGFGRVFRIIAGLVLVVVGVAAWAWAPWRRIGGLTVEGATVLPAGAPDGSRKPAAQATPVRIAVTFSVPKDLAVTRDSLGINFVAARLFSCADPARDTSEVVTQKVEYFGEYDRVTRLPAQGGRTRYRAVFDDRLDWRGDNGRFDDASARAAGPLCFALEGANMAYAPARSATVTLPPLRGPA